MNRLAALLALTLTLPLAACTESAPDEDFREVSEFENGMGLDSDAKAFRIVLASEDGDIGVGRNDLIVRVGLRDSNNPDDEGRGIPNAEIDIDAWMPGAGSTTMDSPVEVEYLGDGAYALDNVTFSRAGVWNVDLDISVGETLHETVTLAFDIGELDFR